MVGDLDKFKSEKYNRIFDDMIKLSIKKDYMLYNI